MERKGCAWWMGMTVLGVVALALAVYALGLVLGAAVGAGSWLGVRWVWRSLVVEAPSSTFVDIWINRPPIARKLAAGVVAAALALIVVFVYYTALSEASERSRSRNSSTQASCVQMVAEDFVWVAVEDPA